MWARIIDYRFYIYIKDDQAFKLALIYSPLLLIIDILQSELPHASTNPNSWGAHATEFTVKKVILLIVI